MKPKANPLITIPHPGTSTTDARAEVPGIRDHSAGWTDADREEVVNEVCKTMQISKTLLGHIDFQLEVLVTRKLSCKNGPHTFTPDEFEAMRKPLQTAMAETHKAMMLILNT